MTYRQKNLPFNDENDHQGSSKKSTRDYRDRDDNDYRYKEDDYTSGRARSSELGNYDRPSRSYGRSERDDNYGRNEASSDYGRYQSSYREDYKDRNNYPSYSSSPRREQDQRHSRRDYD